MPPFTRIEKMCPTCGNAFSTILSKAKRRVHCSKECQIKSKTFPIRPCANCGSPIVLTFKTRKRRFCSYRCSGMGQRTQVTFSCAECQKICQIKPSRNERRKTFTCSRECWEKYAGKHRHEFATPRGESHPFARLTELQVREIRTLIANSGRTNAIARQFGVSPSVVSNIKNGKIWKHVP